MFVVCSLESNPGSVFGNGMKKKRLGVEKVKERVIRAPTGGLRREGKR